jgi:hypothetical protein
MMFEAFGFSADLPTLQKFISATFEQTTLVVELAFV